MDTSFLLKLKRALVGLLLHLNVGTVGRAEQSGGLLPEPQHEGGLQGARPRDGGRRGGGGEEC